LKKILLITALLFFVTGNSFAQKLPLGLKPSIEIILKGSYSTPLSDDSFKNAYNSFPGGQLEIVGNITSAFGVYGNFSADFLSAKEPTAMIPEQTVKQENTYMLSGSIGPRFYFNLPGSILYRFYGDLGLGIYATRPGDRIITSMSPANVTTDRHNVYTQTGFNVGAGINIGLGPIGTANLTLKYHNLFSKSGVQVVNTRTVEGVNPSVTAGANVDVPSRSYFSIAVGLGFKIGL
jgi:hypothetical protein